MSFIKVASISQLHQLMGLPKPQQVFEALHLSSDEEKTMHATVANIIEESQQRIDNHSQRVLVSNLELLLNYSLRYYERQFNTRASQSRDIIALFEKELKNYFNSKKTLIWVCPVFSTLLKSFIFLPTILAI